jgi:hypothetical protein
MKHFAQTNSNLLSIWKDQRSGKIDIGSETR